MIEGLNRYLEETERMNELKLDASNVNYKDGLIESYRIVEDPFQRAIEDLNFG